MPTSTSHERLWVTLRSWHHGRTTAAGVLLVSLLGPGVRAVLAAPAREHKVAGPRVVLVAQASTSEAWTPALRRVRAELRAEGFEPRDHVAPQGLVLGTSPSTAMPSWVSVALTDPDVLGVAVFLEDTTGGAALLWWDRNASGNAVARALEVPVRNGESAEMLAVQTTELAVAAAMQPDPADDPPPDFDEPKSTPPPQPPRTPEVRPAEPHWRASLGFGPTGSPGGLRLMAGPALTAGYGWGLRQQFGLEANTLVTAIRSDVQQPDDRVGWVLLRAHAMWWGWTHRRVSASAGLGGGVAVAWAEQAKVRTTVGLLSTTVGASVRITPRIAAVARGGASWALPGLDVRTGAASVAAAGRPMLDGWIGIQLRG